MCLIAVIVIGLLFLIVGVSTLHLFLVLIPWLIVGLIVGAVASAVTSSRHGVLGDIVIGLAGALIGGVLFHLVLGSPAPALFSLRGLLAALIGAILVLLAVRVVQGPVYR
jgi:uncharacterized membrane protein YeaQ/YmgE (transglycosylase-associated protein family)